MTIPAIAPPERPPLPPPSSVVGSIPTSAPVATGVSKGTVVVGSPVSVTMTRVLDVGRKGTPAEFVVSYMVL